ncbi:MAG: NADH-quinone oxidoreductase subunit NuoE [Actinobacteria bacterium]|nr:NADH-quinone oxidoreductase subunit NuoE [Actinomycetota bacterium]MCB9415228.1 NADH-quinone oxidoreductase subunit NuoE [Actinomycetota bacterium]HRY10546.1 NADH-quinone oxidoreductase subunit NuoE [Candidatus Nanopelagicales bacterium]
MALTEQTRAEMMDLAARYPQARSALLPMLHLVQSEEGYVTEAGIIMCAEVLGLTTAEVKAVATFYTMFKDEPVGEYHIGVCINPGCGILGGDAIWETLSEDLGVGHDEVTEDGKISLERIECQAACTHAPVMTANWEFMDNMTPASARQLVEDLRAGREVKSTRGPVIRDFKATERTLAGVDDDGLGEIPATDDLMLAGLRYAQEHDMKAPDAEVI